MYETRKLRKVGQPPICACGRDVLLPLLLAVSLLFLSFDDTVASRQSLTKNDEQGDVSSRVRNRLRQRGLKKLVSHGEKFLCSPHKAQERLDSLQTLEDLKVQIAALDSEVPFYMDATNVPDAKPYMYKGFVIRPIYIEGLSYKGRCTLIFAWLSTPMQDRVIAPSSKSIKATLTPGTVLLHGGGGTAHKDWVEQWASKGFSSIAVALEGQTSHKSFNNKEYDPSPYPGPSRYGSFRDWRKPLQEQWMFHAVATSMLANTLLRSQPEVNPQQVGVAGVSWGGVITTTVLPLDERYAFAIIAYGSGSLTQRGWIESHIGRDIVTAESGRKEFYEQVWDPSPRLKYVKTPTLWISSPHDKNFSFRSQLATVASLSPLAPVWVANIPDLLHGCYAMYMRKENYSFARTVVETAADQRTGGLIGITGKQVSENFIPMEGERILGLYNATFQLLSEPSIATLVWTEDEEPSVPEARNGKFRTWHEVSVTIHRMDSYIGAKSTLDGSPVIFRTQRGTCDHRFDVTFNGQQHDSCLYSIVVSLPAHTKYWYINVELANRLVLSSVYNGKGRFDELASKI